MFHLGSVLELLGVDAKIPVPIIGPTLSQGQDGQGGQVDPWKNIFPPERQSYRVWDDSDRVHRCPECHNEIDEDECAQCGIIFSQADDDERENEERNEDESEEENEIQIDEGGGEGEGVRGVDEDGDDNDVQFERVGAMTGQDDELVLFTPQPRRRTGLPATFDRAPSQEISNEGDAPGLGDSRLNSNSNSEDDSNSDSNSNSESETETASDSQMEDEVVPHPSARRNRARPNPIPSTSAGAAGPAGPAATQTHPTVGVTPGWRELYRAQEEIISAAAADDLVARDIERQAQRLRRRRDVYFFDVEAEESDGEGEDEGGDIGERGEGTGECARVRCL